MANASRKTPNKKTPAQRPAARPTKKIAKPTKTSKAKGNPTLTRAKAPVVQKIPTQPSVESKTSFVPLDERVLVELTNSTERITAGGLIIPDTANLSEDLRRGVVLKVGRGRVTKKGLILPLEVRIGDRVALPSYAGSEVDWNGKKVVIVKESEILGILDSAK